MTAQRNALDVRTGAGYYGHQPARAVWAAGQGGSQTLCEQAANPEFLWRIEAAGVNTLFRLTFGTRSTQRLVRLRSPLVCVVPGGFMLEAEQLDPGLPAVAVSAMTAATGGIETLRSVSGAAPEALPETARRVTALAVGTALTIDGTGLALAVGASIDVVAPTVLTSGRVLIEHAI
jgi:hypothetical protein